MPRRICTHNVHSQQSVHFAVLRFLSNLIRPQCCPMGHAVSLPIPGGLVFPSLLEKYCDDTRPEQQLARATEQHNGLKDALAQQCHKVSLHIILIGVMGTIYKCHTELPLSKLRLDRCRVRKPTLDINTHSIQYATKIINTSKRLKNIKERIHGSFQNPPDPH